MEPSDNKLTAIPVVLKVLEGKQDAMPAKELGAAEGD